MLEKIIVMNYNDDEYNKVSQWIATEMQINLCGLRQHSIDYLVHYNDSHTCTLHTHKIPSA